MVCLNLHKLPEISCLEEELDDKSCSSFINETIKQFANRILNDGINLNLILFPDP